MPVRDLSSSLSSLCPSLSPLLVMALVAVLELLSSSVPACISRILCRGWRRKVELEDPAEMNAGVLVKEESGSKVTTMSRRLDPDNSFLNAVPWSKRNFSCYSHFLCYHMWGDIKWEEEMQCLQHKIEYSKISKLLGLIFWFTCDISDFKLKHQIIH